MNKILSTIIFSLFLSSQVPALEIGDSMPKIEQEMKGVDGKMWTIQKVTGDKGTLVLFSCNACPYVKAWEDRIVALGNSYQGKGIGVIQINSNDPQRAKEDGYEQMKERAKAKGMKFPYVVDATSDVARTFGARKTPEIYLFDKKGKLVYQGAVDSSADEPDSIKPEGHYLKNAMDSLLENKKIAKAESKAIGCGIKFRRK